ncbi:hypothetical protein SRHO_G00140680 [Serrasalmus rhombeus]
MRPPLGTSGYMHRAFVEGTYWATNSFKRRPTEFRRKHGACDVPSENVIHKMEGTLETTGSLIPSHGRGRLKISQDAIDDVQRRLQQLPTKPLRCLAQETGRKYDSQGNQKRCFSAVTHQTRRCGVVRKGAGLTRQVGVATTATARLTAELGQRRTFLTGGAAEAHKRTFSVDFSVRLRRLLTFSGRLIAPHCCL